MHINLIVLGDMVYILIPGRKDLISSYQKINSLCTVCLRRKSHNKLLNNFGTSKDN